MTRRNPGNAQDLSKGEYLYNIPELDRIYECLATAFTADVIATHNAINSVLSRQPTLSTNTAFLPFVADFYKYSIAYLLFSQMLPINKLPTRQIATIFYTAFGDLPFEVISSFEFAEYNAHNLMFFSSMLLETATNFILMPFEFKGWTILLIA
ncbi:hypothetical protein BCV72DRAFT_263411 [Rhizopus microsporus var. microsporus]|nr:hypothetical protein BCV72DRAFT_263411 [Rhizopus microsporus var. microsporus]